MNELVVRNFGGVEAANAYKAALRRSIANISQGGDDTPILKIDKVHGDWSFGEDNTPVQRDDLWAVHPLDIKHGYVAFDGKNVAEDMDGQRAECLFPVTRELPRYDDLPELDVRAKRKGNDNSGKWMFQMVIRLVCIEGGNKGAQVVYKPTSQGGLRMIGKLSAEILRAMDEHEDGAFVPVVELDNRPYESRTYGPQQQPLAHIVEFITLDADTFSSGRTEADDAPATKKVAGKKDSGSSKRDSGRGGRDDARESAREARREEKSRAGDKVDTRRSRDAEDVDPVEDERGEERTRTAVREEDDRRSRRRGRDSGTDKVARIAREDREREEAIPRGRRARDEDVADDRPARDADAPRGRNAERGGRSRRD